MPAVNKILLSFVAMSFATVASVSVFAQSRALTTRKHKKEYTIGFQTGRELLFNSSPLLHSRQSKVHYAISNTLVLRKTLSEHFRAESGIKYSVLQNTTAKIRGLDNKYSLVTQPAFSVSIPATIQYYFLPQRSRVRPYLGAGIQYGINHYSNTYPPFSSDIDAHTNTLPGTKYISILITQGITFQINTKIQLNESFHFIPGNENRSIGVDFGIGFNIR